MILTKIAAANLLSMISKDEKYLIEASHLVDEGYKLSIKNEKKEFAEQTKRVR